MDKKLTVFITALASQLAYAQESMLMPSIGCKTCSLASNLIYLMIIPPVFLLLLSALLKYPDKNKKAIKQTAIVLAIFILVIAGISYYPGTMLVDNPQSIQATETLFNHCETVCKQKTLTLDKKIIETAKKGITTGILLLTAIVLHLVIRKKKTQKIYKAFDVIGTAFVTFLFLILAFAVIHESLGALVPQLLEQLQILNLLIYAASLLLTIVIYVYLVKKEYQVDWKKAAITAAVTLVVPVVILFILFFLGG